MNHRILSGVLLASLWTVGGCRGCLGLEEPSLLGTTGTTGTGGDGAGGTGGGCLSATDCPAPEEECAVATCEDGTCGVSNAPAGTPCGDGPSCSGGEAVQQDTCDPFGLCVDQGTVACGSYTCASTECKTSCMDNDDCVAGTECKDPPNGSCLGSKVNGEPCAGPEECASEFCADGVCCDTVCNGRCEACSAAKGSQGSDGECKATLTCGEPLATGTGHACAVVPDGTIRCWGANLLGQLGDGTTEPSASPLLVVGVTNAVGVAAGASHTCALIADGTVMCWGGNSYGELGDGTMEDKLTAVVVGGVSNVVALATGGQTSCVVTTSGTVQCWGNNSFGQLGDGTDDSSPIPITVSNISTASAVAVGSAHACALLVDGSVQCWGQNVAGQLGDNTFEPSKPLPVPVSGLSAAVQIAAGYRHTCAVLSSGSARCWGSNNLAQVGDGSGSPNPKPTPVVVTNVINALAISAGRGHSCIRRQMGDASCWGGNGSGEVGNNTMELQLLAVPVSMLSDVVSLHAGYDFTCASLADGTVSCWGDNELGQLGNGGGADSPVPVPVTLVPE